MIHKKFISPVSLILSKAIHKLKILTQQRDRPHFQDCWGWGFNNTKIWKRANNRKTKHSRLYTITTRNKTFPILTSNHPNSRGLESNQPLGGQTIPGLIGLQLRITSLTRANWPTQCLLTSTTSRNLAHTESRIIRRSRKVEVRGGTLANKFQLSKMTTKSIPTRIKCKTNNH